MFEEILKQYLKDNFTIEVSRDEDYYGSDTSVVKLLIDGELISESYLNL